MTVQFSVAVRNGWLDNTETTIGASPKLQIRTGAQPASCAAAATGTLLAEITCPADWMAAASAGTKVLADGHFAFTTTSDGKFWAGGAGTDAGDAAGYVETPLMASYPLENGGSYEFRYTLQGDVWMLERWQNGRRVEREVWQRVR